MVTIEYQGRLGNNIIQYLAGYIFAKKHNFKLSTPPSSYSGNFGGFFKFKEFHGERVGDSLVVVNDENFLKLLESDSLGNNHYHFDGFFQTKQFLEKYKTDLLDIFTLHYENTPHDFVFVHYRIGDIIDDRRMLPLEYYKEALDKIKPKGGYISSENINHHFCTQLITEYKLTPYQSDPLSTINFAKNFNNIILSEGTFSWLMGFLSNSEKIYCNSRDYRWCGDINMSNWNNLSWDYCLESIYHSRFLSYYCPIKLK
jgi:hypothetical protein